MGSRTLPGKYSSFANDYIPTNVWNKQITVWLSGYKSWKSLRTIISLSSVSLCSSSTSEGEVFKPRGWNYHDLLRETQNLIWALPISYGVHGNRGEVGTGWDQWEPGAERTRGHVWKAQGVIPRCPHKRTYRVMSIRYEWSYMDEALFGLMRPRGYHRFTDINFLCCVTALKQNDLFKFASTCWIISPSRRLKRTWSSIRQVIWLVSNGIVTVYIDIFIP